MCAGNTFTATEENMSKKVLSDIYWPVRCSRRSARGTEGRCFHMLQAINSDLKERRRARSMPNGLVRNTQPKAQLQAVRANPCNLEQSGEVNPVPTGAKVHKEVVQVEGMRNSTVTCNGTNEQTSGHVELGSVEDGGAAPHDKAELVVAESTTAPTLTPAVSSSPMLPLSTESESVNPISKHDGGDSWESESNNAVHPVPIKGSGEIMRESTLEAPEKEGTAQLPAAVTALPLDGGEETTCTPGSLSGDEEHSSEEEARRCGAAISGAHPEPECRQPISKISVHKSSNMKSTVDPLNDKGPHFQEEDVEVKPAGGLFSCTGCVCKRIAH